MKKQESSASQVWVKGAYLSGWIRISISISISFSFIPPWSTESTKTVENWILYFMTFYKAII